MKNPQTSRLVKLPSSSVLRISFSICSLFFLEPSLWAQETTVSNKGIISYDTVHVKKGTWFNYKGKTYKIHKDTIFVIESFGPPLTEGKNLKRSNTFYDSVYKKFSRRKFSMLLYGLAFKPPENQPLPGNSDQVKSQIPFDKFKGKVIRHIHIETLDPFGTSIDDTACNAKTGVGRALNAAHMKTRTWVIRKNLFIKEGQRVDPYLLADNERNIREMSFINNVRTVVSLTDPTSDSVDITIVTKDVWSIGFDVITVNAMSLTSRLYDGNFLGLADRISISSSLKRKRRPFVHFDGGSYTYNNIAGTFINSLITYTLDDMGNQNLGLSINRSFYSINTKWAYGGAFQYTKMIEDQQPGNDENESNSAVSYFNDRSLWLGRAFRLNNTSIPKKFAITEAYYQREYTSRPLVSIDSNKAYYNSTRFLTGFTFSTNSYYLTDYILQFGKVENVPYGEAFKLTLGPEMNDFYTRYYGGLDLSAGDFLTGFGYLSGRTVLGGYLNHKSAEDCVLKMSLKYLSPLFVTPDKKFRFRSYLFADYRYGFNFRNNNADYTNINSDFQIDQVKYDTLFYGRKSLSASLTLVMYTPMYFYGFRFAFSTQVKGGFVAPNGESLFHQPFYTGIGIGILIRNDNLIFPPFRISCFYYPSVPHGVPWWQFRFDQNPVFTLPDYNVTMPQVENLQN